MRIINSAKKKAQLQIAPSGSFYVYLSGILDTKEE